MDEIESILVEVSGEMDVHLGDEPKYDPKNRETADHSFPFMIARALVDGEITLDTCSDERIADPSIRPLMRKVSVVSSKEMNDIRDAAPISAPAPLPVRVTMRTTTGRQLVRLLTDHSGCPNRNVTRDKYNAKLDICSRDLTSEQREAIRDAWWSFERHRRGPNKIKTMTGTATSGAGSWQGEVKLKAKAAARSSAGIIERDDVSAHHLRPRVGALAELAGFELGVLGSSGAPHVGLGAPEIDVITLSELTGRCAASPGPARSASSSMRTTATATRSTSCARSRTSRTPAPRVMASRTRSAAAHFCPRRTPVGAHPSDLHGEFEAKMKAAVAAREDASFGIHQ